mmetsp:Transcript_24256/g.77647  ORF Transcript_24256/g.77647 Transcript_24256/m.77647 type:complete len:224 (+) Transcript_24256:334-1005(+)
MLRAGLHLRVPDGVRVRQPSVGKVVNVHDLFDLGARRNTRPDTSPGVGAVELAPGRSAACEDGSADAGVERVVSRQRPGDGDVGERPIVGDVVGVAEAEKVADLVQRRRLEVEAVEAWREDERVEQRRDDQEREERAEHARVPVRDGADTRSHALPTRKLVVAVLVHLPFPRAQGSVRDAAKEDQVEDEAERHQPVRQKVDQYARALRAAERLLEGVELRAEG